MILVPTQVRPSAIHGLGLFAVRPIPKGTPFWRFQAGFDRMFPAAQADLLPEVSRDHLRWFGWVTKETREIVLSGDHACFMNHSPCPNTGLPPDAEPPFTTVALRDIAAGEELTCDYRAFDADVAWKLGEHPGAV